MQSDYIPSGVLQQGLRLNTALPRDVTTIAIIGANRLYKTFGRVLGRLFPTVAGMYVYCDNLQEARSQIVHRRTQSVYYES
jgi:hypothetical protein